MNEAIGTFARTILVALCLLAPFSRIVPSASAQVSETPDGIQENGSFDATPLFSSSAEVPANFRRENLVAWCIVPFDAEQRGPESRASMLVELGIKRCAYDWREEHIPTFAAEIAAYEKSGVEFTAFWDHQEDAFALFQQHALTPQIWKMLPEITGKSQAGKVSAAVEVLTPLAVRCRDAGCRLGLYNHGGWEGKPENLVAICQAFQVAGHEHVGIVYNFHHAHEDVSDFARSLDSMLPHLMCLNINGMVDLQPYDQKQFAQDPLKIRPVGSGVYERAMIKAVIDSGYEGPVGIIGHDASRDVAEVLKENIEGLEYLLGAGAKPEWLARLEPAVQESGVEASWYRGNLHTHSLWSDGNDFPEMITKWYVDNGYHFLALSDHNVMSEGEKWMSIEAITGRSDESVIEKYREAFGDEWVESKTEDETEAIRLKGLAEYRERFEKPGEFLLMTGEEISDSVDGLPLHMNATNLLYLIQPAGGETMVEAMNKNLRNAIDQADREGRTILVHLNHPNFGWAVTAEDMAMVTLERFFEVYNGHPSINHMGDEQHPGVERMWDIANTIRIDQLAAEPLLGLATDDSHHYHGIDGKDSRTGRGWVMVRSEDLSPEAILGAMDRGDFYGSSGVELVDVQVSETSIRIEINAVDGETYTTQFIGTPREYDRNSEARETKMNVNGKPLRMTRIYSEEVGMTFESVEGNVAEYEFTGKELFVRAVVTSSAEHSNPSFSGQMKQAWTQPVLPAEK